jgi:hypothetical protein
MVDGGTSPLTAQAKLCFSGVVTEMLWVPLKVRVVLPGNFSTHPVLSVLVVVQYMFLYLVGSGLGGQS